MNGSGRVLSKKEEDEREYDAPWQSGRKDSMASAIDLAGARSGTSTKEPEIRLPRPELMSQMPTPMARGLARRYGHLQAVDSHARTS
ncbi:MAG TPA: hypothetical protein ENJ18_15775 [Nannocystis exedens]|nr:hypothetical protein [Nannocystis exedens]